MSDCSCWKIASPFLDPITKTEKWRVTVGSFAFCDTLLDVNQFNTLSIDLDTAVSCGIGVELPGGQYVPGTLDAFNQISFPPTQSFGSCQGGVVFMGSGAPVHGGYVDTSWCYWDFGYGWRSYTGQDAGCIGQEISTIVRLVLFQDNVGGEWFVTFRYGNRVIVSNSPLDSVEINTGYLHCGVIPGFCENELPGCSNYPAFPNTPFFELPVQVSQGGLLEPAPWAVSQRVGCGADGVPTIYCEGTEATLTVNELVTL